MKLILNDGTEHEVRSGTLPGTITMEIETYGDIQRLEESLSKSGNLDQHPGSDPNLWTQIVGEDSETKK